MALSYILFYSRSIMTDRMGIFDNLREHLFSPDGLKIIGNRLEENPEKIVLLVELVKINNTVHDLFRLKYDAYREAYDAIGTPDKEKPKKEKFMKIWDEYLRVCNIQIWYCNELGKFFGCVLQPKT